ncbi:MAG: hypothetical protein ABL986_18980 [Vicinamibacterales bacterium]
MTTPTKAILHLVPAPDGKPSMEDLIRLMVALTGRAPTADEIAEAQKHLKD